MSQLPSPEELRRIVREVVEEAVGVPTKRAWQAPEPQPRKVPGRRPLPPPLNPSAIDRITRSTPMRLAQGRAGARYLTDVYVGLRADHAIALDAVNSEVPEELPAAEGWLALQSRCESHEQFLLHPDEGRRLNDNSVATLQQQRRSGADVQIVVGDGLSAYALVQNGPPLVQALQQQLAAAGFSVGEPVFVRFARVGVQDHVGTLLQAKSTLIIVGERPGLGTGDSLSIYTAFGPQLNQDNAEKDCISNIRSLGLSAERAAATCVDLMQRTFAAGGGGLKLV